MGTVIRIGTSGVITGANSLSFGPDTWEYEKRLEGTAAEIQTQCELHQAAGWVGYGRPINGGPRYEMVARYAGAKDPDSPDGSLQTTWELDTQYSDIPAQESEKWTAYRDSIAADPEDAASIDYQMTQAIEDIADFTSWPETRQLWYISIKQGIPVKEARPVLTKIQVYPRGTSETADWDGTSEVWTTAQIEAAETVDETIGSLPTGYWLKCASQLSGGSDGRITVVTRWIMGHYLSHMYTFRV
jgi:hypothetical protein